MNSDTDYSKNLLSFTWAETSCTTVLGVRYIKIQSYMTQFAFGMSRLARKINVKLQPGKFSDSKCKDNNG